MVIILPENSHFWPSVGRMKLSHYTVIASFMLWLYIRNSLKLIQMIHLSWYSDV